MIEDWNFQTKLAIGLKLLTKVDEFIKKFGTDIEAISQKDCFILTEDLLKEFINE